MMRNIKATIGLMCLLLIAASVASAETFTGETVELTRDASSEASISVLTIPIDITVEGWDREEIAVEGRLGRTDRELELEGDEDGWTIRVVEPESDDRWKSEDLWLQVKVPKRGRVHAKTVSGDVEVRDVTGPIHARSVSGDITLLADADSMEAFTVSGDVFVEGKTSSTRVKSVSGEITLSSVDGEVEVWTTSGEIMITAGNVSKLRAHSVSGEIRLEAVLRPESTVEAESHSGEVVAEFGGEIDARFELSSHSGEILSDFGADSVGSMRGDHRRSLQFQLGSGRGLVKISSFSGDILLERLD